MEHDDPYDDGSCGNCGGEGFTFDCIDGCCEDAEMGCDLCTSPCSWCTPPSRNDAALRKILGDAINDLPPPPGDGGR